MTINATAEEPAIDCFVFQARSAGRMLQGDLTNHCSKAVTAYALAATLLYDDGGRYEQQGAGEDFLEALTSVPAQGIGPILPGETRKSPAWNLSDRTPQRTVVEVVVRNLFVVFDDSTAVGDDEGIERLFLNRRDALREWQFWQSAFAQWRHRLSTGGELKDLIDLANVDQRQLRFGRQRAPRLVLVQADLMKKRLTAFDAAIASGRLTRSAALASLERTLAALVSNGERNSTRSK